MIYRDEREALKSEVARLEDDLADAKAKATGDEEAQRRAQELAREAHALREQADRLEREVNALRGKKPASNRGAVIGIIAVASVCVLFGLVIVMRAAGPPPPSPPRVPPEPAAVVAPPPPVPLPPATHPTEAAKPVETTKAPEPKEPPRETKAHWSAKVTKTEGLGPPPGSACNLDATIRVDGTNALVPELTFACGSKQLYSSEDQLNGTSMMNSDARERLGPKNDQGLFSIVFNDTGERSATRNQIQIDSTKRIGSVWSQNLPRFRVDFALPIESAPTTTVEHRFVRTGKVSLAKGAAPAKDGASCTVRLLPTGQHVSCVAEIVCAGKTLVTPSDPVSCDYRGSAPIGAHGSGTPNILIDATHAEVFVVDKNGYRDEIGFDPSSDDEKPSSE